VATRTIELSAIYPEGCLNVAGPYSALVEARQAFLDRQGALEQSLAGKARREIEWLRRGPKARATKAKARIEAAGVLMEELSATRQRNREAAKVGIDFSGTGRQTRRLIVAKGLGKAYDGRTLFSGLDMVLSPGMRLGLTGPNGSGKSTLLHLLAGEERPDAGTVSHAPGLNLVVFDQKREQLDKNQILRRAFAPDSDSVIYRGQPVHVVTWAKRFALQPGQLDLPVGLLSGGEQARVLIARLMLRQADVLLLDEPTNDLDIPTLEMLEESLLDFPGAVVCISHDRAFLDRVSTVLLGLSGQGTSEVYADYAQWEADFLAREREATHRARPTARPSPAASAPPPPAKSSPSGNNANGTAWKRPSWLPKAGWPTAKRPWKIRPWRLTGRSWPAGWNPPRRRKPPSRPSTPGGPNWATKSARRGAFGVRGGFAPPWTFPSEGMIPPVSLSWASLFRTSPSALPPPPVPVRGVRGHHAPGRRRHPLCRNCAAIAYGGILPRQKKTAAGRADGGFLREYLSRKQLIQPLLPFSFS